MRTLATLYLLAVAAGCLAGYWAAMTCLDCLYDKREQRRQQESDVKETRALMQVGNGGVTWPS